MNIANEYAKYDITLWKECSINNQNYGINVYNIADNSDKYMNVDEVSKLFYFDTVQNNNDNLEINTDIIYLGLTGTRIIKIISDGTDLKLLGNNSNYNGKIMIPDNIKNIYFGEQSFTDVVSNCIDLNYIFVGSNTIKLKNDLKLNSLIVSDDNDSSDVINLNLLQDDNRQYGIFLSKLKVLRNCLLKNTASLSVRHS